MTTTFKSGSSRGAGQDGGQDLLETYLTTFGTHAAKRIVEDVRAIREDHDPEHWATLSPRERDRIVDLSLIPEEAVRKYDLPEHRQRQHQQLPFGVSSVYPRLEQPVGQKRILLEDTAGSQGEDLDSAASSCVSRHAMSCNFLL